MSPCWLGFEYAEPTPSHTHTHERDALGMTLIASDGEALVLELWY